MPKPPTYPRLLDHDAVKIDVSDLGRIQSSKDASPLLEVHIKSVLDGKECSQTLSLIGVPKPFGGLQYYFVCPITGKRCRKLYRFGDAHGGRFAHRDAFTNACYSIQTLSKADRTFATKHRAENALNRRGLKKVYRGKPTRRYSVLSRRLQRARNAEAALFLKLVNRLS
jgi:hypothetical protein